MGQKDKGLKHGISKIALNAVVLRHAFTETKPKTAPEKSTQTHQSRLRFSIGVAGSVRSTVHVHLSINTSINKTDPSKMVQSWEIMFWAY